jgi:FlaA1/EpsC-like NDP-sugar epimerase
MRYISPGDPNLTPLQIMELQMALNQVAAEFGGDRMIVLPPDSKVDKKFDVDDAVKLVQHGIQSIDEVRERLDLSPWGLQETSEPVVFTRGGPVPFSLASQVFSDVAVKRVLLTGAGGFAGSHCLEHLLVNTDWLVVCTDSFRHRGKTDRIREVLDARPEHAHRVTVVTHDLTAPFTFQLGKTIGRIDYIFAYASESHVDRSINNPFPFIMNNTAVILNTLEFARQVRPEAMLMVSTDEV